MAELARVVDVFRRFDHRGDGTISRRQLVQVLTQIGDEEQQVQQLLDTYNCEAVNYADFVKWILESSGGDAFKEAAAGDAGDPRKQIIEVFRTFDTNGEGTISRDRLAQVLETLGDDKAAVEKLLEPLSPKGADGAGATVKYEEFIEWIMASDVAECWNNPAHWVDGQFYFAQPCGELPHADRLVEPGLAEPRPRCASLAEFRERHEADRAIQDRLRNKVLVCASCKKACAYTLVACNACGSSLKEVPISYNDNVFMGFIYGVAEGAFPYQISIRRESPELLCFDDPLSMSVCHFCIIPTTMYIPDWRFLFNDPQQALALVDTMADFGAQAALEQYWSNAAFRQKYFAGDEPPASKSELLDLACCGMNFPPSMYQLHLQFIHAPHFPFHYAQAQHKGHYHHGRFFPLEYIRAALAHGEAARMQVTSSTTLEEVMGRIKELGVDYDGIHKSFMERLRRLQVHFCPWKESDFDLRVQDGRVLSNATAAEVPGRDPKSIQAQDDKALRNYGRPYSGSGAPTLSYYRYSKAPHEVADFAPL